MAEFSLIKIDAVKSDRCDFYKLVRNGRCEFDEFLRSYASTHKTDIEALFRRMLYVAQGEILPQSQFRPISTGVKELKGAELKKNALRIYFFHEKKTGKIIVCGGIKGNQKKDVKHFRKITKEYYQNKRT